MPAKLQMHGRSKMELKTKGNNQVKIKLKKKKKFPQLSKKDKEVLDEEREYTENCPKHKTCFGR